MKEQNHVLLAQPYHAAHISVPKYTEEKRHREGNERKRTQNAVLTGNTVYKTGKTCTYIPP